MSVLKINPPADIEKFAIGLHSGKDIQYLLQDPPTSRLAELVSYANTLSRDYDDVGIEVKFNSKYSARVRRIEIAARKGNDVYLIKVTAPGRVDKDAIDLTRISDELMEQMPSISSVYPQLILKDGDNATVNRLNDQIRDLNLSATIIAL